MHDLAYMQLSSHGLTLSLMLFTTICQAASVSIPNPSFESPATSFVDTNIIAWEKSPKPFWYDETANGPWGQLTGVFVNPPPGSPGADHIDNCDSNQAAYLFALPGVALFQNKASTSSNTLDAAFEIGKSYDLTVGVLGSGGGMSNGATLFFGLYFRDAASNSVVVAGTVVTNSSAVFSNHTHFVDFQTRLPAVKATDAWAGKNIGVQIVSTVGFELSGGYWDVDNVRLISTREPGLSGSVAPNGQFTLTLASETGLSFEVLAATNITLAASNWSSLGTVTNTGGTGTFTDTNAGSPRRFYRARQLP